MIAFDKDDGQSVTYSIDDTSFEINQTTGVLGTRSKLEAGETYRIVVTASDNGNPRYFVLSCLCHFFQFS